MLSLSLYDELLYERGAHLVRRFARLHAGRFIGAVDGKPAGVPARAPARPLQVYSGHVHAYERTAGGVYKYQKDSCGPQYTLIGALRAVLCCTLWCPAACGTAARPQRK